MPPPTAPQRLEGVLLSPVQRARLQGLLGVLWLDNPERPEEAIRAQADDAFRLTAVRVNREWRNRASVRLGNGTGPVLVLRTA